MSLPEIVYRLAPRVNQNGVKIRIADGDKSDAARTIHLKRTGGKNDTEIVDNSLYLDRWVTTGVLSRFLRHDDSESSFPLDDFRFDRVGKLIRLGRQIFRLGKAVVEIVEQSGLGEEIREAVEKIIDTDDDNDGIPDRVERREARAEKKAAKIAGKKEDLLAQGTSDVVDPPEVGPKTVSLSNLKKDPAPT